MRCRISMFNSNNKSIVGFVYGRVYKDIFLIDERNSGYWAVTHIHTGCSVTQGVKSQKKAMELIDNIEHVIDWSSIKIINKVLMEGNIRVETTKIKKIQKILERYNG